MIEPGFATMLCFVQTDAEIADASAVLCGPRSPLLRANHRRRADVDQRHGPAPGDRGRSGAPAARRPARGGAAPARPRDRRRRRGGDPHLPGASGRGGDAPQEAERVARAIANSPLVKTRFTDAIPTGAGLPQAAGHGAGRRGHCRARARIESTPAELGARRRRGGDRGAASGVGRCRRPRLLLRPGTGVRARQLGVPT